MTPTVTPTVIPKVRPSASQSPNPWSEDSPEMESVMGAHRLDLATSFGADKGIGSGMGVTSGTNQSSSERIVQITIQAGCYPTAGPFVLT